MYIIFLFSLAKMFANLPHDTVIEAWSIFNNGFEKIIAGNQAFFKIITGNRALLKIITGKLVF